MPLLEIHNLVKTYQTPAGQRQTVLDVPYFVMEAGEHLALAGTSGSGKTTLLNVIAGILRPERGKVRLDGKDIARMGEGRRDRIRAANIGYVFQTFNLLQGYTALENVELGMMFAGGVDRPHARQLLERVGMSDHERYRPRQLSVGQQQRVAVARALANRPRLVLADEPTGNLDPHNAVAAMQLIREVCRENDAALLVVSHDQHVIGTFEQRAQLDTINEAATPPPSRPSTPSADPFPYERSIHTRPYPEGDDPAASPTGDTRPEEHSP